MCNKPEWEKVIEGTLNYKMLELYIAIHKLIIQLCEKLRFPNMITRYYENRLNKAEQYLVEMKQLFARDIGYSSRCNKPDGYTRDERCGECGWHKGGKK